ncbi:MAG TPA: NAD-dependent epimerase/dehydratase family protein [Chthoniobacteraceae bacterium]|nr:NAD-dependent epimerase/dehydratase family protein [Chthoniobacteraceae bacterium]
MTAPPPVLRCAMTGASGYVGSAIAHALRARGWGLLELGRRATVRSSSWHPYTLRDDAASLPWAGIDALVHCAYDFRLTEPGEIEAVNVEGSLRLLRSAHAAGVRRGVFISSMSAFEGCRSHYGQAKVRIEAEALALGYNVVRPGLVFGPQPGGTMGSLYRVAKLSPVLPLIGDGSYPQYLVHEDDLAALIVRLCSPEQEPPGRILSAANPERVPFREVLQRIAARLERRLFLVNVPWPLVLSGVRTLERLRLPSPFRSDSLIGLVYQNPAPDFTLPETLADLPFRPFTS